MIIYIYNRYNVKQTVNQRGIRLSFSGNADAKSSHKSSNNGSQNGSSKNGSPKNDDNINDKSKTIRNISVDDDDIKIDETSILERIPTRKGLIIPDKYIILKKSLLNNVLNDHHAAYEALHKMLPSHVIKALNRGEKVMPEEFDSVTIFFSDIISFTEIAASVDCLLVVKLLNQLYSVMDHCATYFPLFKVETIGDAYMIVISYHYLYILYTNININTTIYILILIGWWYEW